MQAKSVVKNNLQISYNNKLEHVQALRTSLSQVSQIKDNKTKDMTAMGDNPQLPNFGRLINPNLIPFFFFHPIDPI